MKKSILVFGAACLMALSAFADDYKVMFINNGKINADGKPCSVGDVISDKSVIGWTSDKQAIKVQNVKTKAFKVISAMQQKKLNFKTIDEFMSKTGHLSTRGDGLMGVEGLEEYLNNTFYIIDADTVQSMLETTETEYFVAEFSVAGQTYRKKLSGNENSFTIDTATFAVEGIGEDEIPVKIYYHDEDGDELISDKTKVVIIK